MLVKMVVVSNARCDGSGGGDNGGSQTRLSEAVNLVKVDAERDCERGRRRVRWVGLIADRYISGWQ